MYLRGQSRALEDPFTQLGLAEAAAEIDEADERMLQNFAELMHLTRAGAEIALSLRARCRWDGGKATDRQVDAVDRLMMARYLRRQSDPARPGAISLTGILKCTTDWIAGIGRALEANG